MTLTVGDLGEVRLIEDILLPGVHGSKSGDDCAHLAMGSGQLLWSIDPCPTPVAEMLGCCSAEVWGHYTAAINLSDIAASGGKPLGMLISLEMPDDTEVAFIEGFQKGLLETLQRSGAELLGGNVKSAPRFNATGTVIGTAGPRSVTRSLAHDSCALYAIGECGTFWAAVVGEASGWPYGDAEARAALMSALLDPAPQTRAGIALSDLPFDVAAMDCSDGVASAVLQLAAANEFDIEVLAEPAWAMNAHTVAMLNSLGFSVENACWQFGDWQLVCLVPSHRAAEFEAMLVGSALTRLGTAYRGSGAVRSTSGACFAPQVMNKNFAGGYNSVVGIDALLDRFMRAPIFY